MGNRTSKPAAIEAKAIEDFYANLAAEHAKRQTRFTCDTPDEEEVESLLDTDDSDSEGSSSTSDHSEQTDASLIDPRLARAIGEIAMPNNVYEVAIFHLMTAIRAFRMKAQDALNTAIEALKRLGIYQVLKAASERVKTYPWETAAIVVPLILVGCTPLMLGAVGFTSGGIAAASIAAGIQSGIGNVAAGSLFAVLTSAGMGGYGLPLVIFGGWGVSSAAFWGILLAWKRLRKGDQIKGGGSDGESDHE